MYEYLIEPFWAYAFMRRALLVSIVISVAGAPYGVFLMLRRMTLMGEAMSHALLPGVAVGYMISGLSVWAMAAGAMATGSLIAFVTAAAARMTTQKEDAIFAAMVLMSLASGVLIISHLGTATDLIHILFGSLLTASSEALYLAIGISIFALIGLAAIYKTLIIDIVDPQFLRSIRNTSMLTHLVFMTFVVAILVAGFQALGTLLSVGLIVLPAAAARFWSQRLQIIIFVAIFNAVIACYIGLLLSFHFDWSTGPSIILVAGAIYTISLLFGRIEGIVTSMFRQSHLKG